MHPDHPNAPRLLLILTLSSNDLRAHARSSLALGALGLGPLRQGAYELASAMARSQGLRDFTEQFGLEGGIAWLLVEQTPADAPEAPYRPLVDRSERYAAALSTWRQHLIMVRRRGR